MNNLTQTRYRTPALQASSRCLFTRTSESSAVIHLFYYFDTSAQVANYILGFDPLPIFTLY